MKTLEERFKETLYSIFSEEILENTYEDLANMLVVDVKEYEAEKVAKLKKEAEEFDRDRYADDPSEWKTVPGFVSQGGWKSS